MQRTYSWRGPPGRALLALIRDKLTEGDTLSVPNLSVFASRDMREAVLKALLLRGIKLQVLDVEPELAEELAQWRGDFRAASVVRARKRGAYDRGGRPRSVDREPVRRLFRKGLSPYEIARKLDLPTSTTYRICNELRGDAAR